ncbi:hypothetical protein GN244_ATG11809 [Phytophthora infestans]|uniref:Transmembrane protein n=1 Tax=Phytophthora infestans TaxID=4787 RepID=A0A833SKW7_PHYIN|nr:hypothetical protein GN244_ATG11809 [Phytophthora infestans]KAF4132635.1 hypothetical protein GN958_ATG18164 [Phytophthora infestans]
MSSKLRSRALRLLEAWKGLQVSYYGGKYSVHRLLALEAFSHGASLIVCVQIPLPMIILVFVPESVPLQDPKEGWRANYGFWIRVVILTFVITHFSTGQAIYFIDNLTISTRRLVLLSSAVSIIFTLCVIPIGANLIFPLPFSILALTPIYMYNILHIVIFRVIMGGRVVQLLRERREQLVKYMNFLYAQILMMFIYPIYEVLFRYAEGSRYQLLVIVLLPIIKVLIKNVVLRRTTHVEDITPEAVIFTVDFFNAIYVATCMQSASSVFAVLAITVTDLSQTLIMLYGLHGRTVDIRSRVPHCDTSASLLSSLAIVCRNPEKFRKQSQARLRIRSCFPHQVSSLDARLLDTLSCIDQPVDSTVVVPFRKKSSVLSLDKALTPTPRKFWCMYIRRSNLVHPNQDTKELVNVAIAEENQTNEKENSRVNPPENYPTMLIDSFEVLFTMECLVVTAYLEAVIPFFYTAYILAMMHQMNGVTSENVGSTVLPVFVFGLLQVMSFWMLVAVVKRNCGMQALYHLAFVLEAQRSMIQGKLIIWMVITLCFRVVHFGVDFTFQFSGLDYRF